jgi:hypothetical protein
VITVPRRTSSLHDITVEILGDKVIHLYPRDEDSAVAPIGLRRRDSRDGTFPCVFDGDLMLVMHNGETFFGLPVDGKYRSWEACWLDECVDIRIRGDVLEWPDGWNLLRREMERCQETPRRGRR